MNIYIDRGEVMDWETLTDEEREKFNDCFTWNTKKKTPINDYWEEYDDDVVGD